MQKRTMPRVIAHRGASGYLPEHTLEAKALAYGMGADYLEQDVVLTRDSVPIVMHDIHLDTVSDVAKKFPGRARSDGRYYAIDFSWEEVSQLRVTERFNPRDGKAVFEKRFPVGVGNFRIPTLAEEIQFIQGLNRSTGRNVGIYPEIKQPRFHENEGRDITAIVLDVLLEAGYRTKADACYVQCFEPPSLQRLRKEFGCQLKLIQLMDGKASQRAMESESSLTEYLKDVATYADGVGPELKPVLSSLRFGSKTDGAGDGAFVRVAHACGLEVHPWTCRADQLPAGQESFEKLHRVLFDLQVDAVFSDFPDQSRQQFLACRDA